LCPSSDAFSKWSDGHGFCYSCNGYVPPHGKNLNDYTYEFLPWRGVDAKSFEQYGVKTRIDSSGKPISISYPYLSYSKVRSLEDKKFWTEGQTSPGLFGWDKFSPGQSKYCFITEGELDAISLWQTLAVPCYSVSSSSAAVRDIMVVRSEITNYERVYLAFDADTAGRTAVRNVARLMDSNKVYDVRFTEYKDANGYVEAGKAYELRQLCWASAKYLPEELTSRLSDFRKILSEEPKWGVPYPFPTLNEMTYGIRTGESVLITAREGVGKTEVMHTILHSILKGTTANVGGLFLEESNKRTLEAIAGIELGKPVHLPDCRTLPEEKAAAVERVVGSDDRLFIYKYNGISDPDDVLGLIRLLVAGYQCRYVLFDLINVVSGNDRQADERRNLDYLVNKLELMAVELDFALIFVSHVNDNGETRGSRYIAKAANIRIDLDRDIKANSTRTYITLSKNRYSSKTGYAGCIEFDPVSYTLKESKVADNDNIRDTQLLFEENKIKAA